MKAQKESVMGANIIDGQEAVVHTLEEELNALEFALEVTFEDLNLNVPQYLIRPLIEMAIKPTIEAYEQKAKLCQRIAS